MSCKSRFHFCFIKGNKFTATTITTRWTSCRDHPEASVFWLQKATVHSSFQRQRKPEVSAPLKTTWLLETNFASPRSTACLPFKETLSPYCRDLCYILLEIKWVPQKLNSAFSLLLYFNKKNKASSGERWSGCTVLLYSAVLQVTWLMLTGILQPS